jgi:hypothetical protein
MAAFAVYSLVRRLGVGGAAALISVSWFVTCVPMLIFSFEANVETIFVAGYLTAAFFLLRYVLDDGGGSALALAGLSAGLALGTKPTAVVFVPVLLLIGALGVAFRPTSRLRRLRHLIVLFAATLVPSSFWYGRNLWLSGNPLYPLQVSAFGRVWLSGWYESSEMSNSPYYLPVGDWRALVDILLAVFDPRLTPLWLASLVGAWALGRKSALLTETGATSGLSYLWERRAEDRAVWLCAALAVINIALYWLLIPYRTQQRFMLQGVGLAAIPLGRLLDRALWLRWLAVALLAIHLLTAQSWPFGEVEGRTLWTLADLVQPIPPRDDPTPAAWPDQERRVAAPLALDFRVDHPDCRTWRTGAGLALGPGGQERYDEALGRRSPGHALAHRPGWRGPALGGRDQAARLPILQRLLPRVEHPGSPDEAAIDPNRLRGDQPALLFNGRGPAS